MQREPKTQSAEETHVSQDPSTEDDGKVDEENANQMTATDPLEPWSTREIHDINEILGTK